MKKNNILIIFITLLILFNIGLLLFKFLKKNENVINKEDDTKLVELELVNTKDNLEYDAILDKEKYKDYIITKIELIEDYEFIDDEKSIYGSVYIDKDNLLHITNEVDKDEKIISNIKFKTLYSPSIENFHGMYIYLISNNNNLYYISLKENNLKNVIVEKIETKYPVLNFTEISYENDISPSSNTLFVLEQDGNIYEVVSGLRYHENIKSLFDNLLVYEDNDIANIYGKMLQDKNGNNYKIKYAFLVQASDYFELPSILVITEDNQIITIVKFDGYYYAYVDKYKLKIIKYNQKYPFQQGKLEIEIEDGAKFEFEAKCSLWYCPNELDLK